MAGTRRTGFTDAALVRLLAAWRDPPDTGTPTDFVNPLVGWLHWTDAQPLFAALGEPLVVAPLTDDEDASPDTAEADAHGVHRLLSRALAEDAPWREAPRPRHRSATSGWIAGAAVAEPLTFDFPTYRRHYSAQQQAMADRIPPLRARLRRVLELRSPALARLAALDAVMERVLGEPERRLLTAVPALLEQRFGQLRSAAAAPTGDDAADAAPHPRWQSGFQQELHTLLQAELELRWQPIQGLLSALRTP